MSGHSKWATTKHRKGAQDAKRSALFSKLSRNITVAARLGNDPNPDNNASLAAAVAKAKAQSMPKDKIKAAIDKAFGSGADAAVYENIVYEGYGPAGVAVYVGVLPHRRRPRRCPLRLLPRWRQPGHHRLRCLPVRAQGPGRGLQADRRPERQEGEPHGQRRCRR